MRRFLLLMVITLVVLAGAAMAVSRFRNPALPNPESSLITNFVLQTDGVFGYQMLRPANWDAIHLGDARGFLPPGSADQADRVLLRVVNYQTLASQLDQSTLLLPLMQFQQNPSLEGWAAAREREWERFNIPFQREQQLSNAVIYSLTPPTGEVTLVASIIDRDQPLALVLDGFGAYSTREALIRDGIFQDFITMVESVAATDNTTVDPPLDEAALLITLPSETHDRFPYAEARCKSSSLCKCRKTLPSASAGMRCLSSWCRWA